MKTQKLASKIAIAGLLILAIAFTIACYNSMMQTRELCKLTLGTQTNLNK